MSFHPSAEGLMSLLASCPHEWRFWQMMEIDLPHKPGKSRFIFELEWALTSSSFVYRDSAIPFSPSFFYEALKDGKGRAKRDEDFFQNATEYYFDSAQSIKMKNSQGCFALISK